MGVFQLIEYSTILAVWSQLVPHRQFSLSNSLKRRTRTKSRRRESCQSRVFESAYLKSKLCLTPELLMIFDLRLIGLVSPCPPRHSVHVSSDVQKYRRREKSESI